jgi:type IV pilus assembly protein PilA
MMNKVRRALSRLNDEEGFTLVELMVVLVNMGVLMMLSMVAFTGTMSRARDSAAQHGAVRGIETGRIVYSDHASYTYATATALTTAEPNITFVASGTPSSGSNNLSVDNSDATGATLIIASWSPSGNCYFIRDSVTGGVTYGKVLAGSQANCRAGNSGGVTFASRW